MKHIILSAIMIAAIMIAGTGCSDTIVLHLPGEGVNEMALEYLEEKYGEKFEYAAPAGASYTGTRTFLANCESFDDRHVLVQIENYLDEDNRIVKDNYLAIQYQDNVRELFKQITDEVFGSSEIFYYAASRTISPELSADASFEEYINSKEGLIRAVISLPESSYENSEQLISLYNKITETFSVEEISILVVVADDDTFETGDEDVIREIFGKKSSIAQARINRYKGEDELELWENGVKILGEEI